MAVRFAGKDRGAVLGETHSEDLIVAVGDLSRCRNPEGLGRSSGISDAELPGVESGEVDVGVRIERADDARLDVGVDRCDRCRGDVVDDRDLAAW